MSNIAQSSVDNELITESKALDDVGVVSGALEGHNDWELTGNWWIMFGYWWIMFHITCLMYRMASTQGKDGDSTAIIDDGKPADSLKTGTGIEVAANESAARRAIMEPVDHVLDDVSIVSSDKTTRLPLSTEKRPEAFAADIGLKVGATESLLFTAGATEVLDHVPDGWCLQRFVGATKTTRLPQWTENRPLKLLRQIWDWI
jgi:hypothetical protein